MKNKKSSDRIVNFSALAIIFIVIIILIFFYKKEPESYDDQDDPIADVFRLSKPMEIEWIRNDVYKVTVEGTELCNAKIWWRKVDSNNILGTKKDESFKTKKHIFELSNLPKKTELYIGAILIKKYDASAGECRFHTYQAGTYLRTDNFQILGTENLEKNRVRVYATQKNKIHFFSGKNKDNIKFNAGFADNPTEIEPGNWRHSTTLPKGTVYWTAGLENSDGKTIHTGVIKYEIKK